MMTAFCDKCGRVTTWVKWFGPDSDDTPTCQNCGHQTSRLTKKQADTKRKQKQGELFQ